MALGYLIIGLALGYLITASFGYSREFSKVYDEIDILHDRLDTVTDEDWTDPGDGEVVGAPIAQAEEPMVGQVTRLRPRRAA